MMAKLFEDSCTQISCNCTHIQREGNLVADSLAKNTQNHAMFSSQWWEEPPNFVQSLLLRDSLGLPFSRIARDYLCKRFRPISYFLINFLV